MALFDDSGFGSLNSTTTGINGTTTGNNAASNFTGQSDWNSGNWLGSLFGSIPGILMGSAQIVSATQGNQVAPSGTTTVYQQAPTQAANSNVLYWIIGIAVVLLLVIGAFYFIRKAE